MVKGFRQIASLTAFSRVLGLLRDMAYSHFLGAAGLMDAWVIAFKIPNLARRIFGEGAASASFIPVYSEEIAHDRPRADRLACTVVTVVFVILAAVVLLSLAGIWAYYGFFAKHPGTRLMLSLTGIMLPYMVIICVVAILGGILNSHLHFATPAAAPIVLNVFIISSFCISAWALGMPPRSQVYVAAVGVLAAGVVQFAMQIGPLKACGVSIRPMWDIRSEAFRRIIVMMGPMIIGLTVTQINTLADDIIARCLSGSAEKGEFFLWFGNQVKYPVWEGSVSQLYYSQRLYQLPLGVLGISLATAIFPVMSADAARKDFDSLAATVSRGLRGAIFVALPATAGLLLVGRPLVSAIFQHGEFTAEATALTSRTLWFYAVGLCGFFSQQIAVRTFYAMQDSKMPMRSALLAVGLNLILNLTLIWFMGTAGLALSTAICSYLQVVILVLVLRRRLGPAAISGLWRTFIKSVAATAIMSLAGGMVLCMMQNMPKTNWFDVLRLIAVVPVSAGVYFLASKLLRCQMLSLVTGRTAASGKDTRQGQD